LSEADLIAIASMENPVIRVGGLHLFWFGRRGLDRELRVGWQYPRACGVNVFSRCRLLCLFGGFDFWRIPSIASLNPQQDYGDQCEGDRNCHKSNFGDARANCLSCLTKNFVS
jgi:hypothetical protein